MKQIPNSARKAQRRPSVCTSVRYVNGQVETKVELAYRSGKFHESIHLYRAKKIAKRLGLEPR